MSKYMKSDASYFNQLNHFIYVYIYISIYISISFFNIYKFIYRMKIQLPTDNVRLETMTIYVHG